MFSRSLELTLNRALFIAKKLQHEYATYEHLLLSLLEDDDVIEALQQSNINSIQLREDLEQYLTLELASFENNTIEEPEPTGGFQRVVHRAVVNSNSFTQDAVTGLHVLAEFFFEHNTFALACLKEHNITRPLILQELHEQYAGARPTEHADGPYNTQVTTPDNITNIQDHPLFADGQKSSSRAPDTEQTLPTQLPELPLLKKYCTNLNNHAAAGKIDHVIGRDDELRRVIEILSRRHKNNPLLVGEPGVGKTAIAEGLALAIFNKDNECRWLAGSTIYALDIPSLLSGTKYRGDFEERITGLIDIFRENPDYILFVDEIHMLMGAGATMSSGMDASNILKPALARGEIRCIGATTFHEYHTHFEKDAAMTRRFQKVVVDEPTIDETLVILNGLKQHYETYHNVEYLDSAIKAAVTLSEKYIHDKNLPDKAIELIDDAAARKKILSTPESIIKIDAEDIKHTVAAITNVPSIVSSDDSITQLQSLEQKLQTQIFGQDHAINSICNVIKMSRAGLRGKNKPVGSFLFAGTTGVGKTELAKKLAHLTGMKLLKFDMSEYSDMQSISRLIGSAPGYAGYERGGLLTEAISRHPHSIILLDEFEKAHPGIHNLLLQMMDEGQLTDSAGKVAICNQSIIILTSNMASQTLQPKEFGFTSQTSSVANQALYEIKNILPDELYARLDEAIIFNPLDEHIIDQIVTHELNSLSGQLADKKVKLSVGNAATKHLRDSMLQSIATGMRTLKRIIDNEIRRKCAEEILFGSLKNGGIMKVSISNNQIICSAIKAPNI